MMGGDITVESKPSRGSTFIIRVHVDKILRGTKPADIPVEQPSKFDLIINLTTAKALDLLITESLRRRGT